MEENVGLFGEKSEKLNICRDAGFEKMDKLIYCYAENCRSSARESRLVLAVILVPTTGHTKARRKFTAAAKL